MFSQRTFAVGLLLVCLISQLAVAQHYTITNLGPLTPTGINTLGQVVGNYKGHAFIWTKTGGMRDLGVLPGGTFSMATAINDLGVVAGTADGNGTVVFPDSPDLNVNCGNLTQPFVWAQRKGMKGLGTVAFFDGFPWTFFPCEFSYFATGINALGQIIGHTDEEATLQWAFAWTSADGMAMLAGSGDPPSFANGVSNTGKIVGQIGHSEGTVPGRAASWKNGVMTDLGTLSGAPDPNFECASSANGVNVSGQIVGWSNTDTCLYGDESIVHAVLWTTSGAISDLGTLPGDILSVASKTNVFGQVIGSSGNTAIIDENYNITGVSGRPFIWSERSGMRDLNTLIRGNSKWVLLSATDINAWGQIVGQGMLNGKPHGFLLTPRAFFKF
jgi:probable HAF family extracellular repeat protein